MPAFYNLEDVIFGLDCPMKTQISYGKFNISLHRTYAAPLEVKAIPESEFVGRNNNLFAVDVSVEVFGNNFLPAYIHGDNSMVVATDSMKNFILKESANFMGCTLEGLLEFLGKSFLGTYPQMESLRMMGRELPFKAARVPGKNGFETSGLLHYPTNGDAATASLFLEREGSGSKVIDLECGREGFQLMKITGSSFAAFVRDDYTTLPELKDRPLFIHMDLSWHYSSIIDGLGVENYVPSEQIADICRVIFHEFNSKSIQELVYKFGERILEQFPQLESVSFEAQNHTWDKAAERTGSDKVKVFWEPKVPYGYISLTMTRE
jgi:urate oxidase / 2-oxo-4-hydroxy-4-carboxy-5-ureidoimidazoline decarboxylase